MADMACACARGRKKVKYEWTDGTDTVVYDSLLQAKAKVKRTGRGSYKEIPAK